MEATESQFEPTLKKQRTFESNETRKVKLQKYTENEEEAQTRFLAELEFIQCLSNPYYLHCKIISID